MVRNVALRVGRILDGDEITSRAWVRQVERKGGENGTGRMDLINASL